MGMGAGMGMGGGMGINMGMGMSMGMGGAGQGVGAGGEATPTSALFAASGEFLDRAPTLRLNARRKFFHALVVVMFLPGVAFDVRFRLSSFCSCTDVNIFSIRSPPSRTSPSALPLLCSSLPSTYAILRFTPSARLCIVSWLSSSIPRTAGPRFSATFTFLQGVQARFGSRGKYSSHLKKIELNAN
jgi:hypothetical protein